MEYTNKALLYAEKYGIIEYTVNENYMYYTEFGYYCIVNLETMKESRFEITLVKGRQLHVGQKVRVYFNLHKKVFSVQDVKTGLVVAHAPKILLDSVSFIVRESGRQKVIREKKKNVHAFVVGAFVVENEITPNEKAYYNPYKTSLFQAEFGGSILKARSVICENKQITFA